MSVKTYGDVFATFARHPEAKSLDGNDRPGRASGLLSRRAVREADRVYIGKESNSLEEARMGLFHGLDEFMNEYGRARDPWHGYVVPVLKQIPLSYLQEESGLDRRSLQRLRNRHTEPRPSNEAMLTKVAGEWARQELRNRSESAPPNDLIACRSWLELTLGRD